MERAPLKQGLKLTAIATVLLLSRPALAFQLNFGPIQGQLDNKISVGGAWRVAKQDPQLIGIANGGTAFSVNGDDGDLAFKQGEPVSGGIRMMNELSLNYRDYGLFARTVFGYDGVLQNKEFFDAADFDNTLTTKGYTQDDRHRKDANVHAHNGRYADVLDLYAYTTQTIADRSVSLRVGRQTVNWGESTLVLNGLNSLLAFDQNRSHLPGFELSEAIIPANQVWASVALTDKINFEAFYQLRWERTIIDASGSYWGTNDFAAIGGDAANIDFGRAGENAAAGSSCQFTPGGPAGPTCVPFGGSVSRIGDVTPKNSGQFGGALRFTVPQLNDMELAFYAANYHSRLPLFSGNSRATPSSPATNADYFAEYPKDIRMYGLSFNTTLPWDLALQGEYSFKQGQPIQIDDVELLLAGLGAPSQINPQAGATLGNQYLRGWRRKDVSQVDLGLTRIFGPTSWLKNDQTIVLLESAYTYVHDLEPQSVLRYEGPGTYLPGDAATAAAQGLPTNQTSGYATATSYGYKLLIRTDYNNVLGLVNLKPTLRWDHDVKGITPTPIANFVAGRRELTASLGFSYRASISGDIGYTRYIGAGQQNLLRDRDYVEAVVKYSF